MLITPRRCCLIVAYIWPFEVDQMWWIMHSLHFCSLNKITSGKLLPLTSSQRTGGRSFTLSLSKAVLGKHNYSWKHFRVTRLTGDQSFEAFSFSSFSLLLNLSGFNPHFPRAWLSPQMKLMKLSLIMLPWQDIWQKQSWEQREHGDETHWHTLGSKLNWVTRVRRAQSFIPRPFVLFHHRLELCSTALPRNLQKIKSKMDEHRKKALFILSLQCN